LCLRAAVTSRQLLLMCLVAINSTGRSPTEFSPRRCSHRQLWRVPLRLST
jgi:hypothetical protein